MKDFMTDVLMAEGTGIAVSRHVTHHGFFFGHYDAELEERVIPACETFDSAAIDWPSGALLFRVMHRIIRVRKVWGEEFADPPEKLRSRRVYLRPGVTIVRSRQTLKEFRRQLRDFDGADRSLRLGNVEGIVLDAEKHNWGKLRAGERAVSQS